MTPKTQLEIQGSRSTAAITAIIDTGFDGFVCIPTSVAVGLGLELFEQNEVELADCRLSIDFTSDKVQIVRKRTRRRG
jgi:predicted aspartyl protease